MERQRIVQDEDGNWVTRYVDCGPSRVGLTGRPVSEHGRRRVGGAWATIGPDDDPTAKEAIRVAERELAERDRQRTEFADMAAA